MTRRVCGHSVRPSEVLCPSQQTPSRALTRKRSQAGRPQLNLNMSRAMTKNMIETITEAIRDTKHPFRKADSQPKKAMKNRHERRKIKEYLHLADWETEQAT